jgi:hypothetical protein
MAAVAGHQRRFVGVDVELANVMFVETRFAPATRRTRP